MLYINTSWRIVDVIKQKPYHLTGQNTIFQGIHITQSHGRTHKHVMHCCKVHMCHVYTHAHIKEFVNKITVYETIV